jgi:GDPmannose 4,6-dehydratase
MFLGLQDCLYLGTLEAKRDLGHARDYVEMQWLMLQQDIPEDFVIATGKQYSVKDFVNAAAAELGIVMQWQDEGINEVGIVDSFQQEAPECGIKEGNTIVRVDPRYFRPTEVETLLGDPTKAKEKLGWQPKTSFQQLVAEMMRYDLDEARRDELCKSQGFKVLNHHE